MDEIREVEAEMRRLKEEADRQKGASVEFRKQAGVLEGRNEYLVNKLKEAAYVYGEAGKRLLFFINNQVNPITERLNKLESGQKRLSSEMSSLNGAMASLDKAVRDAGAATEERLEALGGSVTASQARFAAMLKAAEKRMGRGDAAMDAKVSAASEAFEKRFAALSAAIEKKESQRLAALGKSIGMKLSTLRERDLLLGKDIEALRKLEAGFAGLDGRVQEVIGQLSQQKLDREKLSQRSLGAEASAKAELKAGLEKASRDAAGGLARLSSELRQADEKNLGALRLEMSESAQSVDGKLAAFLDSMKAFQKSAAAKAQRAESSLSRGQAAFSSGMEKRLKALEKVMEAEAKSRSSSEKSTAARIAGLDASLTAASKELEDTDKRVEQSIKLAAAQLQKQNTSIIGKMREDFLREMHDASSKASLLGREVQGIKAMEAEIKSLTAGVRKGEGSVAGLEGRMDEVSQALKENSAKDDLRIRKGVEVLESQVKSSLEAAEARLTKESLTAFSAARADLMKGVQEVREENTRLKAEIKNLHGLLGAVGGLQKDVAALSKKSDDLGRRVERVSDSASSGMETESLKVSKDLAAVASKVKAELKDMVATEREKFAGTSADLAARHDALSKSLGELSLKVQGLSGQERQDAEASAAGIRHVEELERKVEKLLAETARWRKEYKEEVSRLLKEIEG